MRFANRNHRLNAIEHLEHRLALSADGLAWGNAPYLSLSFAPDGTDIDGVANELFSAMNSIAGEEDWQNTIVDAFQTWAYETNGDIAVTSDSGDPFGTPGATVGDGRFGDIRVGAIPLNPGVFAVAVTRGFVSGTWSGDVLFNTRTLDQVGSVDELFRIALHEAGHVYGFEDSTNPNHVMHGVGIPSASQPTLSELDELWARFGMRSPDINERHGSNNVEDDATHLYSSDDGFDGTMPLIHHGDIGPNDVDIFRFDVLELAPEMDYVGPVTFEVRTEGLSQLNPEAIKIVDKVGTLITTTSGRLSNVDADGSDGRVALTLDVSPSDEDRYFIYVDSNDPSIRGRGGYALVTTFDGLLASDSESKIEKFSSGRFRFLEGDDILDIFLGDPDGELIPFFRDDMHTNDTLGTATLLEPIAGFADGVKYELLGSISDNIDVDFYSLESADTPTSDNVMTVLIESVESTGFDPSIQIFDSLGMEIPTRTLLHHGGRQVIQFSNLTDAATYYISVAKGATSSTKVGNYRVAMRSGTDEDALDLWRTGATGSESDFIYVVNRPELTMFAVEAGAAAPLDVTIAKAGLEIASFSTLDGSFRSNDSLMLDTGVYRIRVESAAEGVTFDLMRAALTDPLAVAFVSVDDTPVFHVDDFDEVFVFPGSQGASPSGPSGLQQLARLAAWRYAELI